MSMTSNNNKRTIRRMAARSTKKNRLHTAFILMSIILSVVLLMVMGLYDTGYKTSQVRAVDRMQHAIYMGIAQKQLEELDRQPEISELVPYKSGKSVEREGVMITPVYYEKTKADSGIDMLKPAEGHWPKEADEVVVSPDMLKDLGTPAAGLGDSFDLTFLDGSTEHLRICGLFQTGSQERYTVLFSKAYAEEGTQLKDVRYDGVVQIRDARHYNIDEFNNMVYGIGERLGIPRQNINANNFFQETLAGNDVWLQQKIATIGIGMGILAVSVLVIYSVFYLSVVGKIREFGQYRTIGMTKKQIRRMLRLEGLLLTGIGAAIGIPLGWVIGYFLVPAGWAWGNSLMLAGVVLLANLITVQISLGKPAKMAASISPIEAAKFAGYQKGGSKGATKKLHRRMTPFGMALIGAANNKKKTLLTAISLGVGGVLFMVAASFIVSVNLEEYARAGLFRHGEFALSFDYNTAESTEGGQVAIQRENLFSKELVSQIQSIPGVKQVSCFGGASVTIAQGEDIISEFVTGADREELGKMKLEDGVLDYDGLVQGDGILICGNEHLKEVYGWEYKIGDAVQITFPGYGDGVAKTYTVQGMVDTDYRKANPAAGGYILAADSLREMTGGINLTTSIAIDTEPNLTEAVGKELEGIADNNPMLSFGSLQHAMNEYEMMFQQTFVLILGLALFIIGFSMLNLINTLITNIITRKREFSVLQSVGMSTRQLKSMIMGEGMALAVGNILITGILGTAAGIACVEILRAIAADYMHFHFPGWYFLGYVVFLLTAIALVSAVCIRFMQKQPLVERMGRE